MTFEEIKAALNSIFDEANMRQAELILRSARVIVGEGRRNEH